MRTSGTENVHGIDLSAAMIARLTAKPGPDLQRLPFGEGFRPFTVTPTHIGIDEYDVASQGLVSHHYRVGGGATEAHSVPFRYVWPAELDLMARLAGMRLRNRWSGWNCEPFTNTSTSHVSVWEKL